MIERSNSKNAALAQTLKADIAALPAISTITPSKTSGNLDYVASARSTLADKIKQGYYSPQNAGFIFGLLPQYRDHAAPQKANKEALEIINDNLRATSEDLGNLKRIIEYAPLIDLQGDITAQDTAERLERTQQGIKATYEYVRQSNLSNSGVIANKLNTLAERALYVTNDTKNAWSADVLEVQKMIITNLESQDISKTDYTKTLSDISISYQ